MLYILGLGNIGEKYDHTRHNVGRNIVREIAGGDFTKSKHANALFARGSVGEVEVEWLLPETFMNKSGDTVRYVVKKHDAKPEQFIVLYDDVDVPFGEIKISVGRGDGGHNGVKSIIGALGSKDFVRIRVGIAPKSFWTGKARRPQSGAPMTRHVLGRFSSSEQKKLQNVQETVKDAIVMISGQGIAAAMNQFN